MYIELPFLAPIPVGHEIVLQRLERETLFGGWEDTDSIVLDRVTGIIWSPWIVPFGLTPENFHVQSLGHQCRRKDAPVLAQVVGCQVSSKGYGDSVLLTTALVIAPVNAAPYR